MGLISEQQLEFYKGIYNAYTTANDASEKCLNFDKGVKGVVEFLESQIGTKFTDFGIDDLGFSGFIFNIVSLRYKLSPNGDWEPLPEPDHVKNTKIRIGLNNGVKIWGDNPSNEKPWIIATSQERTCSSNSVEPKEIFDFNIVVYLLPMLQDSEWDLEIETTYVKAEKSIVLRPKKIFTHTTTTKGSFVFPKFIKIYDFFYATDEATEVFRPMRGQNLSAWTMTDITANLDSPEYTRYDNGLLGVRKAEKFFEFSCGGQFNAPLVGYCMVYPNFGHVILNILSPECPKKGERKRLIYNCCKKNTVDTVGICLEPFSKDQVVGNYWDIKGGAMSFEFLLNPDIFADTYGLKRELLKEIGEDLYNKMWKDMDQTQRDHLNNLPEFDLEIVKQEQKSQSDRSVSGLQMLRITTNVSENVEIRFTLKRKIPSMTPQGDSTEYTEDLSKA